VRRENDNSENNEVVEFSAAHQYLHYIARRDAPEASASEQLEAVPSGTVRFNVNQRFALKDAGEAHKTFEARATSASTIPTI
jgi:hypothetical protein